MSIYNSSTHTHTHINTNKTMKKLEKLKQSKLVNTNQVKGGILGGRGLTNGIDNGVLPTMSSSNELFGDTTVADHIDDGCTRP